MENRASRGALRETAILTAATELFLIHGYEGTSLDMVIDKAGGSRRTIYERFGNKEGLFSATVEAMLDRLLDQVSSLDWKRGTPEQALQMAGTAFVTALTAPEAIALFRIVIAETTRFPALGAAMFEKGPERSYRMVADYLRMQADAGHLRIEDANLAARQLVEMFKGDIYLRAMLVPGWQPGKREIECHVQSAVEVFLRGVDGKA
ncbi:TetR/AcrR family transcriptional regulator [Mesorhizobium xinjiangense]|uniref:TetR/AcrR family transcriptional regulator n=1 Tax=Mesorhizobium xinjiangense TaxID=2678685 RepID=UPI0012EE9834|nr:TetR/AcrR family transcriptional regulator [Mesorhizobium xinjiangense]